MALTPYLGEIVMYSFNFAPKGWAQCNGQLLPINQNQALFSILGTTYGGDGRVNFALPDLRGRVAMYSGNGHTLGERSGQEFHTVTMSEMPQHIHVLQANTTAPGAAAAASVPANTKVLAPATASLQGGQSANVSLYGPPSNLTPMAPAAVTNIGGSQPHENRQPYGVVNFCIALQGVFPSRN
jgi:microcystin-dependent protein